MLLLYIIVPRQTKWSDIHMMLGELYFTRGVVNLIEDEITTKQEIMEYVFRHQRGDYGLTCKEDIQVNERNLNRSYGTVMSEYIVGGRRIWVCTTLTEEVQDIYTTVMLPSEW